jgi:hypothetical protein
MIGTVTRKAESVVAHMRLFLRGALGFLLAVLLVAAPSDSRTGQAGTAPAAFSVGERFVFRIDWNPPWYLFFLPAMEAGKAVLSLAEETEYQNKRTYKLVFTARSSGTMVKLAGLKVDDYYEFYTDPETFCTFAAFKKEREGKRKRDIEIIYFPESQRLHIKDVDVASNPPKIKKDAYVDDVPTCVRDVFSALYALRMSELATNAAIKTVVGDNDRVKEVESRVEKRETVDTPAGKFAAWRVNTVALMGGLFKEGGQFKIWLSVDEKRLPVQFEARVYLGKVTGKLTEYSSQSESKVAGVDRKPNSVSPRP